jgi:catechol 2,3-dioxygenase-like lactoylglutathione lyase family enzyme
MITGLSHACFHVTDLQRSISFYRDKLGLSLAFELNLNQGKVQGVYLHVGGRTFIELFQGTPIPTLKDASYKHICLEVDDIQKTVEDLQKRGVEVGKISLGGDQSYQAWLADPDGNRIELHQFTDKSLQIQALERLGG